MLHLYQVAMHLSKKKMKYETNLQLLEYCNVPQCNEEIKVLYLSLDMVFYLSFHLIFIGLCPERVSMSMHHVHHYCNEYNGDKNFFLDDVYPHEFVIIPSTSSSATPSSRRFLCLVLFLYKAHNLFRRLSNILPLPKAMHICKSMTNSMS